MAMLSIRRVAQIVLIVSLSASIGAAAAEADRKLIAGTKEAPPFAMKLPNGDWTGISIDLWRQIARELGREYEVRELADLQQLLDRVADSSLDVAVGALTITADREEEFDFSHTFYNTGLGIAVPTRGQAAWAAWFRILSRVWSWNFLKLVSGLALLLLGVGFLVWLFERKANPEQFGGKPAEGLGSSFWWAAVTMTTVGYGDKAPRTLAGRFVGLIWMFASLIVIATFTAAITAALTVSELDSSITGPRDLVNARVVTVAGSTSEDYLKEQRLVYGTHKTLREALDAIASGAADALVFDEAMLRYVVKNDFDGRVDVLPAIFEFQDYGFALPAGSNLREPVNRALLQHIGEPEWRDTLRRYLGE